MVMTLRGHRSLADSPLALVRRTLPWEDKLMRRIGFAPWNGYPRIDDPTQDDETFAQQRQRLAWILALPDDETCPAAGEHPKM
jgi:hypothetical protein